MLRSTPITDCTQAVYYYLVVMQHFCVGSMHRCHIGASSTARCKHTAVSSSTASFWPHTGYTLASAPLPAASWSYAPPTQHAEHPARGCNRRFHLHRMQAGDSDPETSTNKEIDTASPTASDDSFWSNRSVPVPGPDMPFGLLLGLASAGALETAYLTAVRGSSRASPSHKFSLH